MTTVNIDELTKVSGKLFSRDEDGNRKEYSYEDVLISFLKEKTPQSFTTEEISKALDMPYDTIQPKLKALARASEKSRYGVRLGKMARPIGERGRRKYLWSYE